jgi:hypothetical protein
MKNTSFRSLIHGAPIYVNFENRFNFCNKFISLSVENILKIVHISLANENI